MSLPNNNVNASAETGRARSSTSEKDIDKAAVQVIASFHALMVQAEPWGGWPIFEKRPNINKDS